MARSLNKVMLIGNLTRDPEMRYTPNGAAVCTFGVATNRDWKTETGEKKEEVEFHNIVAWSKLAEICSQLLKKGRKVFVEGRLATRSWQGQDGSQKQRTEIVISDMVILDKKMDDGAAGEVDPDKIGVDPDKIGVDIPSDVPADDSSQIPAAKPASKKKKEEEKVDEPEEEDIPF